MTEVLGAVLVGSTYRAPPTSFAKSLPVVQRGARARRATLVSDHRQKPRPYTDKGGRLRAARTAIKARARKKRRDNIARWRAIANLAAPGPRSSAASGSRSRHAHKSSSTSPQDRSPAKSVALSAWHLAIRGPGFRRTIGAPLSRIFTPQFQAKSDKEGLTISPASLHHPPDATAPSSRRARRRDVRWMFAGNILAAYDQTSSGGQIITHTMEDGSSRAAILMPKAFKRNDFMANRPIRFAKAQPGDAVHATVSPTARSSTTDGS